MKRRVAVVTDAVAEDFIFPIWYRYYGKLFGEDHLFVVTYAGLSRKFQSFRLGGLIELPVAYDDTVRRDVINGLVSSLLPVYDTIIRVDVDEFLVVDPRASSSLADFVENSDCPYMTARGFDVIQLAGEASIPEIPGEPILNARTFAYPNTALNKTCVVKTPVTWSEGFHWASVYPVFGPLFMLHMKRLDVGWQIAWFRRMSEHLRGNPKAPPSLVEYYLPDEQKIISYHQGVENRRRLAGIDQWYRLELTETFLHSVTLAPNAGLYVGKYDHEGVLCQIIDEWRDTI